MDLILWRHAEAREGTADLSRRLTRKGQQQAQKTAEFLMPHLPKTAQVWTSQAARSQETAAFLECKTVIKPELNPDADYLDILPLIVAEHGANTLVLVGHQPWLGELWAHLMSGGYLNQQADGAAAYWSLKKSAFVWLKLKVGTGGIDAKLLAALSPSFLGVNASTL